MVKKIFVNIISDLELNRKFTLTKPCWDSVHLERIDLACDPTQSADLAAIVMQVSF